MSKIMVTGAAGQIGCELTLALRKRYGNDNVVATGRKTLPLPALRDSGPFHLIDVTDPQSIESVVDKYQIDTIVHLAALLSAVGEQDPSLAWEVNVNGLLHILNTAVDRKMVQVVVPSSIGVFGPGSPLDNTPNDTVLRPTTMYGITKVSGELLCNYYVHKYNLDVRGLRYPGIISSETLPGGGTTDYAVEIFYEAVNNKRYTCFLRKDTRLPMMYMPDCIKATLDLMDAPFTKLKHHADFNLAAMNFSAEELVREIKKHVPDFECTYKPDFRQAIADSWPNSLDDTPAREEWGWKPRYNLSSMAQDMLEKLGKRHRDGNLYK
ncbi:MAG: NAD-dependent epimerase/dehydratase family protein [Proteobacteria bacterium]|nr:NAD-dependent epimerase/dehydratase family protein [Pseudomonadota bacterium]